RPARRAVDMRRRAMRRQMRGHQSHFCKTELLAQLDRCAQMADMNGIEGAAEQGYGAIDGHHPQKSLNRCLSVASEGRLHAAGAQEAEHTRQYVSPIP